MVDELLPPLNAIIFEYFDIFDWDAIRYFHPEPIQMKVKDNKDVKEITFNCGGKILTFTHHRGRCIEFLCDQYYIGYNRDVIEYISPNYDLLHYICGNIIVKFQDGIEIYTSDEKRPMIPDIIPEELHELVNPILEFFTIDNFIYEMYSLNEYQDWRDPTHWMRNKYKRKHNYGLIDLYNWWINERIPFKELLKV